MNFAPGTTIGGKYQLVRRLAVGGQGSVWVAKHVQLESEAAIKFLDLSQSNAQAARMRFEREARAAAKIPHQHLVSVIDVGEHEGTPYLIMELFEGENLDHRLKRQKRLDTQSTAHILNQIARGLRRIHEAGFVHRDLKPSNIFLAKNDDGDEVVKILDFGIVKETNPVAGDGTKTGEFMGSVYYVSPEQIKDAKTADLRSDLWSLGVILYRALTGKLPFPGPAIGTALAQILAGPLELPSSIEPELPKALDVFFKKALNRNRNERFQNAIELAEAFAHACNARPPQVSLAVAELSDVEAQQIAQMAEQTPFPLNPAPPPRRTSDPKMNAANPIALNPPLGPTNPNESIAHLMATVPLRNAHLVPPPRHFMGTQKLPPHAQVVADPRPHHQTEEDSAPQSAAPIAAEPQPPPSYASPISQLGNSIKTPNNPMSFPPGAPSHLEPDLAEHSFRPRPSNTRWVVGGLLLGTLVGGLIALIVLILRNS